MTKNATFNTLWKTMLHAFVAYADATKKKEGGSKYHNLDKRFDELLILINRANAWSQDLNNSFLAYILQQNYQKSNLPHVLWWFNQHGLELTINLPYFDETGQLHAVSLLTFVSQFNNVNLVKFLVETAIFRIANLADIHPIFVAHRCNHTEVKQYLIEHVSQYSDYTYLTAAVCIGNEALLVEGLANASEINQVDANGYTPIMHAIIKGRLDFAQILLQQGADPFLKNHKGQNCFHWLFEALNDEEIDQFLTRSPDYSNAIYTLEESNRDIHGAYPIHYATRANRISWVKKIINTEPQLAWVVSKINQSIAFYAVFHGHLELVKCLHELHVLIDNTQVKFSLDHLIMVATYQNQPNIIIWLCHTYRIALHIEEPLVIAAIFTAIQHHNTEIIKWWFSLPSIDASLRTYTPNLSNNIAIFLAQNKQSALIKELDLYRKNPALLFTKDHRGQTSLDYCFFSVEDICHDLIEEEEVNTEFVQIMVYALPILEASKVYSWNHFSQCITMLRTCLKVGLLTSNSICHGQPLFHILEEIARKEALSACSIKSLQLEYYHLEIESFINQFKPDLNIKDRQGCHLFAKLIDVELGPELILWFNQKFNGFKTTELDIHGSSLLHLASAAEAVELVRWACETRSMSATKIRKDGLSALDLALTAQNTEIAHYLVSRLTKKAYQKTLSQLSPEALVILSENDYFGRLVETKPTLPVVSQIAPEPDLLTQTVTTLTEEERLEPFIPTSETEPLNELDITFEFFQGIIENKDIKGLMALKKERYQEKLYAIIEPHIFTLFSLTFRNYKLCYQFLRLPACVRALINHWPAVYDNFTNEVFSEKISLDDSQRFLLLFNKYASETEIHPFGFDTLRRTLNPQYHVLFQILLLNNKIAATVSLELMHSALALKMDAICDRLMQCPTIIAHGADNNNALFRTALENKNYDICGSLLRLDAVQTALAHDDYALAKEAIAQAPELFELLDDIPKELQPYIDTTHQGEEESLNSEINLPSINNSVSEQSQRSPLPPLAIGTLPTFVLLPPPLFINNHVNIHIFYDAIAMNNYILLHQLCLSSLIYLDNQMVKDLASFSLICNQPLMLQCLLYFASDRLEKHPSFCNYLMCQAMRQQQHEMVNLLNQYPMIHNHASLFNNRLLRVAIISGFPALAADLLDNPSVRRTAHIFNNTALRRAHELGYARIVNKLLTIPNVRRKYHAFATPSASITVGSMFSTSSAAASTTDSNLSFYSRG